MNGKCDRMREEALVREGEGKEVSRDNCFDFS